MSVAEILESARITGIALSAEGDTIKARSKGATPADLAEAIRANKPALLAHLRAVQEEREIDRLAEADGWKPPPPAGHPAYSILETCREYGVALRIDDDGDLVVGKAGAKANEPTQPWPTLLAEIEAHLDAVAQLVEAGWHLRAGFPKGAAA